MRKIDTQIRHITQPTDNIFADLGLEDTGNLKKEADALANAKLALTRVVADWVQENHFKQEEAAEIQWLHDGLRGSEGARSQEIRLGNRHDGHRLASRDPAVDPPGHQEALFLGTVARPEPDRSRDRTHRAQRHRVRVGRRRGDP